MLLRQWDEKKFLSSLNAAEKTPRAQLNPDGNRAVIYCSTTDPYQTIYHPDPLKRKELGKAARHLVRRSLELIRDKLRLLGHAMATDHRRDVDDMLEHRMRGIVLRRGQLRWRRAYSS